jgi:dUTP pyrophosphatase
MDTLKVKLFSPDAVVPFKAHDGDAGYDIASVEEVIIPAKSWKFVDTGLGITVPIGTYGRLAPRSGLSKYGIMVNAGVIDLGYTGKILCCIVNMGDEPFEVKKGMKICQLILEKIVDVCEVKVVDELAETTRSDRGFGSTGI